MALYQLPTGYIVSCRGTGVAATEQYGGVILGITDATTVTTGSNITQLFTIGSGLTSGAMSSRRSQAYAISGTNHSYSAQKAVSVGTFGYNPNHNHASSGYVIRTVTTALNNIANTSILIGGNEKFRLRSNEKNKAWGAKTSTAWRLGYFSYMPKRNNPVNRTNWTTAPTALNDTFKSTQSNTTDANDEANYVTYRSVPGELVYLGGSGIVPNLDNYKAKTL
jgi:hypothetical protein